MARLITPAEIPADATHVAYAKAYDGELFVQFKKSERAAKIQYGKFAKNLGLQGYGWQVIAKEERETQGIMIW